MSRQRVTSKRGATLRGTPKETFGASAATGVDVRQRRIEGLAVAYGSWIDTTIPTVLKRGAFSKTLRERFALGRVALLRDHNPERVVGKILEAEEEKWGLRVVCEIARTPLGDEALELARMGALTAFSVGFTPAKQKIAEAHELGWCRPATVARAMAESTPLRVITEVRWDELSLVPIPASDEARFGDDGKFARRFDPIAALTEIELALRQL